MVVAKVASRNEFNRLIDNDTVVLDLCMFNNDNSTDTQFEELSIKYPSIKFVKTDGTLHPEVGGPRLRLLVPHHFQIFKDGVCKSCYVKDVRSLDFTIADSYQ
ncbi:MAG: hypothetical protein DHS80DRAFT_25866 [Piptocephalis tieghemiana]|nr:MAG: hypothetical protein DHS80DRAFT_25866 [Piptocephalis tieghemiana]